MKNKRIISLLLSAVLITTILTGCGSESKETSKSGDGRIQIKVQYMCGRMNLDLESVLESKFPNVDIVTDEIVGEPGYVIAKEMEHGMEPDIYLYEGLSTMDDALIADKFYDLSQEAFTNNFWGPLKTRPFCPFLLKSVILKAFRTQMQHIRAIISLSWGL